MSSYPLYDHLLAKVNQRTDKAIDILSICTTLNAIGQNMETKEYLDHYYEIMALIYHHSLVTNRNYSFSAVPYDGTVFQAGEGVLYHGPKLPVTLQHILAQYIEEYKDSN